MCAYVPKKKRTGSEGRQRVSSNHRFAKMSALQMAIKKKNDEVEKTEEEVRKCVINELYDRAAMLRGELSGLKKIRREKRKELDRWKKIQTKSGNKSVINFFIRLFYYHKKVIRSMLKMLGTY